MMELGMQDVCYRVSFGRGEGSGVGRMQAHGSLADSMGALELERPFRVAPSWAKMDQ